MCAIPKFNTDHFETLKMFCHGLKVCMGSNCSVVECLTRDHGVACLSLNGSSVVN